MNEDIYPFEMYCDCTGTGYHGDLCEIDDCINCNGNQTCTEIDLLVPNNATCECKGLFSVKKILEDSFRTEVLKTLKRWI